MKKLPSNIESFFITVGEQLIFLKEFFRVLIKKKISFKEFLFHCYETGVQSIGLVALTGFIIGFVLTLQSRPTLADFGATALIPAMVTVSVFREIGPVVTSLICAGKIGSRISAEIGAMRVTEQIDALQVSVINPIAYLVVPRVLATTIIIPLLVIYSDFFSVFGSFVAYNIYDSASATIFINSSIKYLEFSDVIPSLFKSAIFGFFIGIIPAYYGYYSNSGTQGVGRSTNSAVVASSVAVFIVDMVVVQMLSLFQ